MAMFMFIDCYGHESQLDDNDGQYDDAILTEVLQEDITVERERDRERETFDGFRCPDCPSACAWPVSRPGGCPEPITRGCQCQSSASSAPSSGFGLWLFA